MKILPGIVVVFFYGSFQDALSRPQSDLVGPPISQEEMKESMTLQIAPFDLKDDPITKSGHYQGDIMLPNSDNNVAQPLQRFQNGPGKQDSAISNPYMKWPRGVIPYIISSEYKHEQRLLIARSMSELSRKTCLRFVPRQAQRDYIYIHKGEGCSSYVGRTGNGQPVSLNDGCLYFGVILHEFIHAAGFWHEQSRYDRDNFVHINYENIIEGLEYNFDKASREETRDLGLPYDYASIMHYGSKDFSKNNRPTIVPRVRGVRIGQRDDLSQLDVRGLNLLYNCRG